MNEDDPKEYLKVHTGKLFELIEDACQHVPRVTFSRKEFRVEDYHIQHFWIEQMVWWRNARWKRQNEGIPWEEQNALMNCDRWTLSFSGRLLFGIASA